MCMWCVFHSLLPYIKLDRWKFCVDSLVCQLAVMENSVKLTLFSVYGGSLDIVGICIIMHWGASLFFLLSAVMIY